MMNVCRKGGKEGREGKGREGKEGRKGGRKEGGTFLFLETSSSLSLSKALDAS